MKEVPLPRILVFSLCALCLWLSSCSDSEPEISSVKSYVIFDYASENALPEVRLAVFSEISEDVRRAEVVSVKCLTNNYEWNCTEPVLFSDTKKQWAGYTKLLVPKGALIPQGAYSFVYYDAGEKSASIPFFVNYDEDAVKLKASQILEHLGEDKKPLIEVYSAKGSVLYYGMLKNGWADDKKIFSSDRTYESFRRIYTVSSGNVMYVMPPVYRNEKSGEN